jgi:hypothetical protein
MYAVVICCHTNLMKNLLHIPSLVHKSVKVLVYRECMCTLPGTLDHHYPLLSITIAPPVFLACFLQLPGGLDPCVPWMQLWAQMGQHESWIDGHPVNRAEGPAESYPNTQEGSYNMGGSLKSSICLDGFFHEIKHVIQLLGHPPILWKPPRGRLLPSAASPHAELVVGMLRPGRAEKLWSFFEDMLPSVN